MNPSPVLLILFKPVFHQAYLRMWPFSPSNSDAIEQKRAERAHALADGAKELTEELTEHQPVYLRATASEIVSHIEKGEWTASEVLEAYIRRAIYAQEKTNSLTEVFFARARQRAAELDTEFAATKKLKGPLHGVPISIKDQLDIEGLDSTIGFSQWANKPSERNADVVDKLLDAGAILFVKTNVPQTMFAFECCNPVWGRTTNPYNDAYTCGGSSGGEAALLAMDGSAAGIGSDIGGSLRIPAAYCGVYSLKPGSGRVSYVGARGSVKGFDAIPAVAGPMGRSVKDLELVSRVIFGAPSTDNAVPPLPFNEVSLPKKMKFGYYTWDKYIKASPACQRAVLQTVEALRRAGHDCVEFEIPDTSVASDIFVALTSADAYKTMLSHLGPDKKENALFLVTLAPALPSFLRKFAALVIETMIGDKVFAGALRSSGKKNLTEYWKLNVEKNEYKRKFEEKVWRKYQFDAIIAPVQAVPQLPHGGCDNFSALATATLIYNVLDLPTGCLPVTRVKPSLDEVTDQWFEGPGHGSSLMENGIFKGKNALYNPKATKGMPINIQIVGKKWEEEKLLAIMSVVDEVLGERGFGPGAWDAYLKEVE